ncbi:MAG: Rid family hydrolase [Solirubrobacteraceae bacterium]
MQRIPAENPWEERLGASRACRRGGVIEVSGTTAPGEDAYAQARDALAGVLAAVEALGGGAGGVVRTRIFVVDIAANGDDVGRAHSEVFGLVAPACGVYGVAGLRSPDLLVEIEATARLGE